MMPSRIQAMRTGILAALCAITFMVPAALAQSVQVLGDYRDWSAYTASENSGRLCFTASQPKTTEPQPEGFGDSYVYLTTRVSDGTRNEFNLIAGYEFAPDSVAQARVGGQTWDLYTQADAAWLQDASQGSTLAGSMRAGSTLVIEGTSAQGIRIVQTFSLSGVTAASRAVDQAC